MSADPNIKPDELSTDSPSLEPFVDAQTAAKFWAIERRQLLAMARCHSSLSSKFEFPPQAVAIPVVRAFGSDHQGPDKKC